MNTTGSSRLTSLFSGQVEVIKSESIIRCRAQEFPLLLTADGQRKTLPRHHKSPIKFLFLFNLLLDPLPAICYTRA